jgi:hypothetical protein
MCWCQLCECVDVFNFVNLLDCGGQKTIEHNGQSCTQSASLSHKGLTHFLNCNILCMCMFNIKQLNSMFRWANQSTLMCLCIFVLKDESTLWFLYFDMWFVHDPIWFGLWILSQDFQSVEIFFIFNWIIKNPCLFIPQIDIYIIRGTHYPLIYQKP